ncbi:hypothetical protein QZH41_005038 [Actinostola sp. cb2023]|nr:hypothetical protein QZH41_005038 [Actinostola sp. cb2023]
MKIQPDPQMPLGRTRETLRQHAAITNNLLERLTETAKFHDKDPTGLQTFADLCADHRQSNYSTCLDSVP